MPATFDGASRGSRKPLSMWVIAPIVMVTLAIVSNAWARITTSNCAAELRTLYFSDDFGRAVALECARGNLSPKAQAWLILNEARAYSSKAALPGAQFMASQAPDDPYAKLAMAGALLFDAERSTQALDYAKAAAAQRSDDDSFQWIYLDTLRLRGHLKKARALTLANPLFRQSALLHSELVSIDLDMARNARDDRRYLESAFATALGEEAIKAAIPRSHLLIGTYLLSKNRPDEALPFARYAYERSYSDTVLSMYFDVVRQALTVSEPAKLRLVDAAIERYRRAGKLTAQSLFTQASFYQTLGKHAQARRLTDQMIAEFPQSPLSAQERYQRILMKVPLASVNGPLDRAARTEVISTLAEMARGHDPGTMNYVRNANMKVLDLLLETPDDHQLLIRETAQRLATRYAGEPEAVSAATVALATVGRPDPAQSARAATAMLNVPAFVRTLNLQPASLAKMQEDTLTRQLAYAVGYAEARRERTATAKRYFEFALRKDPTFGKAMIELARLYEAQGFYDVAEHWFVKCSALPYDPKVPCANSLSEMYKARHGSEAGLGQYLKSLKPKILKATAARLDDAVDAKQRRPVRLDLRTAGGRRISSAAVRGKVLVLIYWGIWCDACRIELPELFSYAQLQQANKDVQFIAINDGRELLKAREWLRTQRPPLAVVDGQSATDNNIIAVPTILFVDRKGREAYRVVGLTGSIDMEFGKRIAKLRNESPI